MFYKMCIWENKFSEPYYIKNITATFKKTRLLYLSGRNTSLALHISLGFFNWFMKQVTLYKIELY